MYKGNQIDSAVRTPVECSIPSWSTGLALPARLSEANQSRFAPLSYEDRELVKQLFNRIRVPWRFFLAHSAFAQITVPEIAHVVSRSQRYNQAPQTRIEATRSFLKAIVLEGPDSPEGNRAIELVNAIHHRVQVDPRSPAFSFVLYTLSTEFIRSLRFNSRINPTAEEEVALFHLVRRVGEKMGVTDGMDTYPMFLASNKEYLHSIWGGDDNVPHVVAQEMLCSGLKRAPCGTRTISRSLVVSLIGEPVIEQLKLPAPTGFTRQAVRTFTKLLSGRRPLQSREVR